KRYTLITEWKDVSGLKVGATVRLSGWDVGEVTGIEFASQSKRTLIVTMSIERQYQHLIRQCSPEQENPEDPMRSPPKVSSEARIDTIGILGDKLVTINIGDSECTQIPNSGFIRAEEAIDIVAYAKKVTSIVNQLDSIGRKVDIMLGTEDDARKTSKSIANSVQNLEEMTKEIKEGEGLIHAILYDKKLARNISSSLDNLNEATSSLNQSVQVLETGDGVAHELIYGHNGREAVLEIRNAATTLSRLAEDFEKSNSLAYTLLYDPSQKEILNEIKVTIDELKMASQNLNEGDGTAALLLRDPTLYEDLRTLVGGAKRNKMLRSFIRWTIQESEHRNNNQWKE
ncbi:MAG: MlaD family protein, partial [Myxococcota bacterium]|nr:MlaD family protein [Myxococcota bacterium]